MAQLSDPCPASRVTWVADQKGVVPVGSLEWAREKNLLTSVARLPRAERLLALESAFPGDPELRARLAAALDACDRTPGEPEALVETETYTGPQVARDHRQSGPALAEGTTFGPYRILCRLGEGGMGEVWLAEDTRLGRRVALKSLKGDWLNTPNARQTVMGEGRASAGLVHPNIATLFDVFDADGQLLLVMEYVEGRTLSALVAQGAISPSYAMRIIAEIAGAVGYAHDRGIIHCDLKPGNIQIGFDGSAKILDFGLARAAFDASDPNRSITKRMFAGTPPYLAPERVLRGSISAAGDIYSLGVMLYELTSGRRPFDEPEVTGLFLAILFADPPPPSQLVGGLPPGIDGIVARAMARDPRQRYQTAWEFRRDLRGVLELLDTKERLELAQQAKTDVRPAAPDVATTVAVRPVSRLPSLPALVLGLTALLLLLTGMGFVCSVAYNVGLGRTRTFGAESPLAWPYWGLRSLIAPMVLIIAVWILAMNASGLWRLVVTLLGFESRRTPFEAIGRAISTALDGVSTLVLSQLLLAVHVGVLVVFVWRFWPILNALSAYAGFGDLQSPTELLPLRPSNFQAHNGYRQILTMTLLVSSAAWFIMVRRRLARDERDGLGPLIAGLGATLVTAALLVCPFRIIWHNQGERATYGGVPCHLVGSHDNEALLFCPSGPPPWKRVVALDSPALVRHGLFETIFTQDDRQP